VAATAGLTIDLVSVADAPREVKRRLARDAEEHVFNLVGRDTMALPKMADVVLVPKKLVDRKGHASSFHCSVL